MRAPLTTQQDRVLRFIRDSITISGMPPTRQDIADFFKWKSPNAAHCILVRLEKKGYVKLLPLKSRAIEVIQ